MSSALPEVRRPKAPGEHGFYLPELDGLRFAAFMAVFVYHVLSAEPLSPVPQASLHTLAWWKSSAILTAVFGVDVFFVLSSFLITSLLLREIDLTGRLDVRAFWVRRILRIWPLYYAFLLTGALAEGLPWRVVAAFAAFAGNWALLSIPLGPSVISPLWSVSIEEQFYLTWPLLLLVIPRRRLPWLCLLMLGCSLTTRALILANGGGVERLWVNTFARLDPIVIGALIALAWRAGFPPIPSWWRPVVAVGAVLTAVTASGWLWHETLRPPSAPEMPVLIRAGATAFASAVVVGLVIALTCGVLLVVVLSARGGILAHPVLVYLGKISYGLYLFHLPGLHLFAGLWWPLGAVLALALTTGVAALSYRYLERPFLTLKQRFTHVPSTAP